MADQDLIAPIEVEAERYEFFEKPAYQFDLQRRDFFKWLGGGVMVFCAVSELAEAQQAPQRGGGRGSRGGGNQPTDLGAWIHINEDGKVTVFTGKVEIGQNIRTSLSQVVAEELRVPLADVQMVMADTAKVPYDFGTNGSSTTPRMAPQLRRAAATARELMLDLAAESLHADRGTLVASDGKISGGRESRTYGQLSKGQKLAKEVPQNVSLAAPEAWKVAGKPVSKINGRAIVTGQHHYATDIKLDGMLFGKVLRPPSFGATLKSADLSAAKAMPGVIAVQDGNFAGVAAPDIETAEAALAAIKAEWATTEQPSEKELFTLLKTPGQGGGGGGFGGGRGGGGGGGASAASINEALAAAHQKLEETYTIAYIAHVPLETRSAVAQWEGDKLTVWTGTQRPFGTRSDLAQTFRLAEENVRVVSPDTGSGYGGKQTFETAIEAARIAKAAGKPVKLIWTREEELTWAYFRPAGVIDVRSGVNQDGLLTAWDFQNYNSGGSGIQALYAVDRASTQAHNGRSPLRQGSYRALASTANHFARESHIDGLASALKMDPVEFRLKNLKDERIRKVLEEVAKAFDWKNKKSTSERGYGIACGSEKGGFTACAAEVSIDRASGKVKVERIVSAFDCGPVINPDGLKNQIEGCVMMGIGGALFEAIHFENGKILNPQFSSYRVPRFSDLPALETILVDRKNVPSAGAGECPIVCVAPAIGNAIFHATGVRLRSLPMIPNGLKV